MERSTKNEKYSKKERLIIYKQALIDYQAKEFKDHNGRNNVFFKSLQYERFKHNYSFCRYFDKKLRLTTLIHFPEILKIKPMLTWKLDNRFYFTPHNPNTRIKKLKQIIMEMEEKI